MIHKHTLSLSLLLLIFFSFILPHVPSFLVKPTNQVRAAANISAGYMGTPRVFYSQLYTMKYQPLSTTAVKTSSIE